MGREPEDQSKVRWGRTYRAGCSCGGLLVDVVEMGDRAVEVELRFAKGDRCGSIPLGAISRLVTLGLEKGVHLDEYIKSFREMKCELQRERLVTCGRPVTSCVQALAGALLRFLQETQPAHYPRRPDAEPLLGRDPLICPDCGGGPVRFEQDDKYCLACGYSFL
jgi:hypothetical protein